MSIPATPQQNHSREVAIAAIAQAYRQIGADQQLVQDDETACKLEQKKKATRHPSDEQPRFAGPGSSRGRLVLRSLMALLAVACIGVAAFAWPSPDGQAAPEPISTSSVSIEKKELPAPSDAGVAAETDAALPQQSSQAQTNLQRAAPEAPTAAAVAPDLAQSIQMITRELANVEQEIDQLKTGQAQMVRDSVELVLKATQEMARNNADLGEQLKANHEQMANIAEQLKQSQEQIARLGASGQKQRPRTLASSPLPTANATRKPVRTRPSPRVRVQTQDPTPLQPEQQ